MGLAAHLSQRVETRDYVARELVNLVRLVSSRFEWENKLKSSWAHIFAYRWRGIQSFMVYRWAHTWKWEKKKIKEDNKYLNMTKGTQMRS